ncbi:hypothetical protein C0J29_00080 [Mycobacterium paragordonae]|uniref:DUF2742 domain-containing protein n=1 Tax=Mycobacterium paragordonae TaxID=1389713 RepID=A0ABQ1CD02_9MYCO|nr:DUF2742 domain-containing protein [Mycobacterium paragordonae]AYE93449.1 hypothetical protein C0J29_00080 [Mycobacterium paragordonae]GFG82305.1 hypothetical protein MPRG_55810 [Mycobacterium paragordonae]
MSGSSKTEAGPQWAGAPPSQQCAWWPVHEFLEAVVQQANYGQIPAPGTPSWCALADGDPRKLLSVAIAGEHHVLRVETAQEQFAEASKAIAGSADWSATARAIGRRREAYIPRRSA